MPKLTAKLRVVEQAIKKKAQEVSAAGGKPPSKAAREKPIIAMLSKVVPITPELAIEKFSRMLVSKPRKKKRSGARSSDKRSGGDGDTAADPTTGHVEGTERESTADRAARVNSPYVLAATQPDLLESRRASIRFVDEMRWNLDRLRESRSFRAVDDGGAYVALARFLKDTTCLEVLDPPIDPSIERAWKTQPHSPLLFSDMTQRKETEGEDEEDDKKTSASSWNRKARPDKTRAGAMPDPLVARLESFVRRCKADVRRSTWAMDWFFAFLGMVDPMSEPGNLRLTRDAFDEMMKAPSDIVPDALHVHIHRLTLLSRMLELVAACLSSLQTLRDGRLALEADFLRAVHYYASLCRDAFWFVGYAFLAIAEREGHIVSTVRCGPIVFHEQRVDTVDPHWELSDVLHELTLPVLCEILKQVYISSDTESKRCPIIHLLSKLALKKSMYRMGQDTTKAKTDVDFRLFDMCTQFVMCSLLGNYSHLSPRDRPRMSKRCYLYHRLYIEADASARFSPGYCRIFETLKDIGRLPYHALHQAETFTCRANPFLMVFHGDRKDFEEWNLVVDDMVSQMRLRILEPTLCRLFARQLDVTQRPLARASTSVLALDTQQFDAHLEDVLDAIGRRIRFIDRVSGAKSKNAVSDRSVSKARLGFFTRLQSIVKKVPVTPLPMSAESAQQYADLPLAQRLEYTVTTESFGLEVPLLHWIKNLVDICDDDVPFPEGLLFRILDLFAVPAEAKTAVETMYAHEEDGRKEDSETKARWMASRHPRSYALLQAFIVFWQRKIRTRVYPLPAQYAAFQLAAIKSRAGIRLDSPFVPQYSTELRYCDVCNGQKRAVREVFGKEEVFGKDAGHVNIASRSDPLDCIQIGTCQSNCVFAGARCGRLSTRTIDLVGKLVVFNGQMIMICPQYRCGIISEMSRDMSASTNRGKACSDCSMCLAAASCELEQRGLPPLYNTSSSIASEFMSQLVVNGGNGGAGKGQTAAVPRGRKVAARSQLKVCELCGKEGTGHITSTIHGLTFLRCKSHSIARLCELLEKEPMKKKRNDACAEGTCTCDNLVTTCNALLNKPTVIRMFRSAGGDAGISQCLAARNLRLVSARASSGRKPARGRGRGPSFHSNAR